MKKAKLLIRGNLICKETLIGGGKNDLIIYADESEFDISEAVVMDGNVTIDILACNGIVLVTGAVLVKKEG